MATLVGVLAAGGAIAAEAASSIPAARVNGIPIERDAVLELVKGLARSEPAPPGSDRISMLTTSALESLIDLELLYQEALRTKVGLAAGEVDSEIAKVRQHFDSQESFESALAERGLTVAGLRLDTRKTLLANRLLQRTAWRDVSVSSEEIGAFYSENESRLDKSLEDLQDSIALMLLDDKKAELRSELVAKLRQKATIERLPPFAKPSGNGSGNGSGDAPESASRDVSGDASQTPTGPAGNTATGTE